MYMASLFPPPNVAPCNPTHPAMSYKKISAIVRTCCLDKVRHALEAAGAGGLSVTHVRGQGEYVNTFSRDNLLRYARVEVFAPTGSVERLVAAIHEAAHSGQRGDGMIAVLPVESLIRIRTGEPELATPPVLAVSGPSCCAE